MFSTPILLALLLPSAQAGGADRLAKKADKAFSKEKYDKALEKCSKALDKEPGHLGAASICGTVLYLWGASEGDAELMDTGSTVMEGVALADPWQPYLQLYRQIRSGEMMEAPNFPCGDEESAAWGRAEQAYMANDLMTARGHYEVAAKGCENPTLWTYYGDTFFAEQDYTQAFAAYEHALEIDPYHWSALRFIGDGHIKQGDEELGFQWVAKSLAANPVYEYAWIYLDEHLDMRVKQVRGTTLPIVEQGEVLVDLGGGMPPFTSEVNTIYQISMQASMERELGSHERVVKALSDSLGFVRDNDKLEDPGMELWGLLAEAEDAGHFEDAVFVLLLSPEMVPAFMDYREANTESLAAYVFSLLSF